MPRVIYAGTAMAALLIACAAAIFGHGHAILGAVLAVPFAVRRSWRPPCRRAAESTLTASIPAGPRELAIVHLVLFDDPGSPDDFHRRRACHDAALDALRLDPTHADCDGFACPRCDVAEALAMVPVIREILLRLRDG